MNEDCNNCQHQDICKWVEEYQRVNSEVDKVTFDKVNSPIRTNTSCLRFQRKSHKEDGFILKGGIC